MIQGKKILAVMPARGGSKGIPLKNIKDFAGKPLIGWTIDEIKKSEYIDEYVVSTEDARIMDTLIQMGEKQHILERPQELAQDDTPSIDPVLHVIEHYKGYDYVVLLQVTSPMRTVEDIDGCIRFAVENQANSCVSVCKAQVSPYWMYTMGDAHQLEKLIKQDGAMYQRQQLPQVYQLNGAIYIDTVSFLQENRCFSNEESLGYVMSEEHSGDIDTPEDFAYLEYLKKNMSAMK